jgi:hypothetical protein
MSMYVIEGKEPFICCNWFAEKICVDEIEFSGREKKLCIYVIIGLCSYIVWKVGRVFSKMPSAQLYVPM